METLLTSQSCETTSATMDDHRNIGHISCKIAKNCMVIRRMVHNTEDLQVAVSHFNNRLFSKLQFQLVRNSVLDVKVAIQGEQIKKIVAVLELAKC